MEVGDAATIEVVGVEGIRSGGGSCEAGSGAGGDQGRLRDSDSGSHRKPTLYIVRRGLKEAIENEIDVVLLDMNTPVARSG